MNTVISTLDELKKALKDIPKRDYHIGGFSEESICIEETKDRWQVYFAERGMKQDLSEYENFSDACEDMIERLSE